MVAFVVQKTDSQGKNQENQGGKRPQGDSWERLHVRERVELKVRSKHCPSFWKLPDVFCHVYSRSHFVKHELSLCPLVFNSGGEMANVLAQGASLGKFSIGCHSPSFCKPFSNLSALADRNGPQIIIKATQPLPREERSMWQDICPKLELAYCLRVRKLVPWGGCLVSCRIECLSSDGLWSCHLMCLCDISCCSFIYFCSAVSLFCNNFLK